MGYKKISILLLCMSFSLQAEPSSGQNTSSEDEQESQIKRNKDNVSSEDIDDVITVIARSQDQLKKLIALLPVDQHLHPV